MKRLPWAAFCLVYFLAASAGLAHEEEEGAGPPAKVSPEEQHRASVLPDRVLLSWAGNPAHTQNVSWRTSVAVNRSFVEYAVATGRPDFGTYVREDSLNPDSFGQGGRT